MVYFSEISQFLTIKIQYFGYKIRVFFLYENLFFFARLNRFLYIWVLKCPISACRFLNHQVLIRGFLLQRILRTRWREDMNSMFSWQEQYLTSERRSLVRSCSSHENIKFIIGGTISRKAKAGIVTSLNDTTLTKMTYGKLLVFR